MALNADFFRPPELANTLAQTGAEILSGEAAGTRRDANMPRDSSRPNVVVSQNFCSERGEDFVARIDLRQTLKGWRAERQQLVRMCGEVIHADKGVVEELLPLKACSPESPGGNAQPADRPRCNSRIGWKSAQQNRARCRLDFTEAAPRGDLGSDVFDVIPWDDEVVVLTGLRPDFADLSQYYWIRPVGETDALITLRSIAVRLSRDQGPNGDNVRTKIAGTKVYEAVAALLEQF